MVFKYCVQIYILFVNCVCGLEYLMTFVGSDDSVIETVSGEQEGRYTIIYPPHFTQYPPVEYTIQPYSTRSHGIGTDILITREIETKSIIVNILSGSVKIYGKSTFFGYTPLPLDALGNRYVFSACDSSSDNSTTVLLVATHRKWGDVNITFSASGNVTYGGRTYSDGDTLSFYLDEYQTFIIESQYSLTGSVLRASEAVAVYSGTRQNGNMSTFFQLLPSTHLGREYFLAVDDTPVQYSMQLTSIHTNTTINVNNAITFTSSSGTISLGFGTNGTLFAVSNKPIIVVLCRGDSNNRTGAAVVPSVSIYQTDTAMPIRGQTLKILAVNKTENFAVNSEAGVDVPTDWTYITEADYYIGTLKAPLSLNSSVKISSSSGVFSVYSLSEKYIYNGGYGFPFENLLSTLPLLHTTTARLVTQTDFEDTSTRSTTDVSLQNTTLARTTVEESLQTDTTGATTNTKVSLQSSTIQTRTTSEGTLQTDTRASTNTEIPLQNDTGKMRVITPVNPQDDTRQTGEAFTPMRGSEGTSPSFLQRTMKDNERIFFHL